MDWLHLGVYDLAFIAATFVQPPWLVDFDPYQLFIENWKDVFAISFAYP